MTCTCVAPGQRGTPKNSTLHNSIWPRRKATWSGPQGKRGGGRGGEEEPAALGHTRGKRGGAGGAGGRAENGGETDGKADGKTDGKKARARKKQQRRIK